MRALAMILLATAAVTVAACGPDSDQNGIPPDNAVEIDPCVGEPNSPECRAAEAKGACSESANETACIRNYLETYPPADERQKPPTPADA